MYLTRERAAIIPEWLPPAGYIVRPYRPGDDAQWIALLAERGFPEFGNGQIPLDKFLAEPERRDGSRLIEYNGQIVAATMASQFGVDPPIGALDYVIASPAHSGRQLGYWVCAAVIRHLVSRGYPLIELGTDDCRPAAIKTYLKLGFEPNLMRDATMPERWKKVLAELNWQMP